MRIIMDHLVKEEEVSFYYGWSLCCTYLLLQHTYTICNHHVEFKLCGHGTYGHFTHEPRVVIT